MAQAEVAEKKTVKWSHGRFHWNERLARDVERAKRFYRDTIGWTFEAMPTPDNKTYWIAKMGDQPVAGIFDISGRRIRRRAGGMDAVPRRRRCRRARQDRQPLPARSSCARSSTSPMSAGSRSSPSPAVPASAG